MFGNLACFTLLLYKQNPAITFVTLGKCKSLARFTELLNTLFVIFTYCSGWGITNVSSAATPVMFNTLSDYVDGMPQYRYFKPSMLMMFMLNAVA